MPPDPATRRDGRGHSADRPPCRQSPRLPLCVGKEHADDPGRRTARRRRSRSGTSRRSAGPARPTASGRRRSSRTQTGSVEADPDGRRFTLRSTLSDGVTVDHEITPGATRSPSAWSPPTRPIGLPRPPGPSPASASTRSPGVPLKRDSEEYLPRSFIFLDGRLARLPTKPWATQARYIPGQVWCPAGRRSQRRQPPAAEPAGPLERPDRLLLRR